MIEKQCYGVTGQGNEISLYRMTNKNGAYVEIINYGARIVSICVPDRNGELKDICLGYDTLAEYEKDTVFLGAAIGRFGNRIANASFTLNNQIYNLEANEGKNHLHGGSGCFGYLVFDTAVEDTKLIMSLVSPDGEAGYPGELKVSITYEWDDENRLSIQYDASTDKDTVVNLTNHAYFNLNGADGRTILEHDLKLYADAFTPVFEDSIPTGEIRSVEGTPFDFREKKKIGKDFYAENEQIQIGHGYDHNFVLANKEMKLVAELESSESGICMSCYTVEPGMQFYSGNFLDTDGKYGVHYGAQAGLCLETQHFPNSINEPKFDSPIVKAGDRYYSKTIYSFGLLEEK